MPQLLSTSADELTSFCQTLLTELLQHLKAIEECIRLIEASIQSFMRQSSLCKKIAAIPGIGPITATAIVAAVGDARQFRNGRHLAAWLGLVPRQYSSGGKPHLQGISPSGGSTTVTRVARPRRNRGGFARSDRFSIFLSGMSEAVMLPI